jgi:uncharacterized protein YutE (UPF0331/DUF86 family)
MTIDRDLVVRKMLLIVRDLDALRPIAERGPDAYRSNEIDQAVAERYLLRLIGRMIDINFHLITARDQPPPSDYYASFVQLGTLGILDAALARQLAASAGLRNRLVHEYDDLDPARVFEGLEAAIRLVPAYLQAVERCLPGAGA